ncbi:MAG: HtrA protease/chaperone protein [Schlesneria sp.]|nr:HtrA protease/chaperone protein [Schlesneria sp.]
MKKFVVVSFVATAISLLVFSEVPCSGELIQSGFNDVSGINSNSTVNSPFNTGNASLNGQGTGEAGWAGPWHMTVGSAVVNSSTTFEGDGAAAFFQNTAAADRTLAIAPTDLFRVSFELLLPTAPSLDVIFRDYDSHIPSIFSAIAVQWSVGSDLQVSVLDGVEDSVQTGGTYAEPTGIFLSTGVWHEMTTIIDPVSRTWTIAVDGKIFVPTDPLGFRGVPKTLDSIQFLNENASPKGSYIDAVTIDTNSLPSVPEPSAGLLMALGLIAFAGRSVFGMAGRIF